MSPYVELHCHSNFSLLDGASPVEDLVTRAAALGMPALALTDHDAVYGVPQFIRTAREHHIHPVLGAEMRLADGHHLTLLVENKTGWHNLCYLISRARGNQPKGESALPVEELVGCTQGLIALSGCRRGEIAAALLQNKRRQAMRAARRYTDLFGRDNFWIELQRHYLPNDELLLPRLTALASYMKLSVVATNNVHYATPDCCRLQDVLVATRHLTTLEEATHLRRPNSEYYLKSPEQMAALFADYPQAIANTLILAERCQFELNYGLQGLPQLPTPHGMSSSAYLRRLCDEALHERCHSPTQTVHEQLRRELDVIERAGLANYFLIVGDIVRFALEKGIRCQGRGSAANSLVSYLLRISPVDPLAHDLVFERFLSDERKAAPDIDMDFDAERREEVIQYIYERYGEAHAAMACTFVTYRSRSAIRDVGKALGVSPAVVGAAVKALETQVTPNVDGETNQESLQMLLELCDQIDGFPRHLGIHSGGMIITGSPLMGRVPTEPATMPGRVVTQWDKEGLEELGLVKIDILGLRMLSAISEAVALVGETTGTAPDLDDLDFADTAVYEMIAQADTIGVFQVESRAQAQMLPKLKPRCFGDLVIAISLIRPGPIQGNMVHPFLRRRAGLEPVTYLHPLLQPALEETLGVILFQEQVLKVARDLAGFSAGQGELLRRALGAKQAEEKIEEFRGAFLVGAGAKGVPADVAETVFEQLCAFGGYSFAKSHAAAFAVLVYQSAWLKKYHFAAFYVALLNNQPMGFWNPAVLVNEIRRKGVTLLPVDIHQSQAQCTLEGGEIRLGFNYVKGLGEAHIEPILAGRDEAPYASLDDFCCRTRLGRQLVENLIMAGAMDAWGISRRQLVWELGQLSYQEDELDLVFHAENIPLPALTEAEAMMVEHSVLGFSTGDHVMTLYRDRLMEAGIFGSKGLAQCGNGRRVRVAGLLVVHQSPPTAKGFHFLTLEDEDGMMNVIVQPQIVTQTKKWPFRPAYDLSGAKLILVDGIVQRDGGVINVLASRIRPLVC